MNRKSAPPARGILKTAVKPPTGGHHTRTVPVEPLNASIAHFWSVSWAVETPYVAETLPHPSVHVTIEGARHEIGGVHTKRFVRRLEGEGRVFGVKFRPAMFHGFYGQPVRTLANRIVSIGSVFGRDGERFARAISAASDDAERMALAERFFLKRLPAEDATAVLLRDVVEVMAVDREMISVNQVAVRAGLGVRTLQRLFQRFVGVSPKWVLHRYRLHEAAERLATEPVSLAQLAADLGYADQSHFVRDFKAVVGRTPGAYLATK